MNLIGGLIGCAIGGLIGGGIWTGVSYGTGYEIGWIAWGVGVACGLGMAIGSKREAGQAGGVIAAAMAVASILVAKYVVVDMLISKGLAELPAEMRAKSREAGNREYWVSYIADDLIEEREAAGEKIQWPPGVNPMEAEHKGDYPPEIWAAAAARWDALSPDARKTYVDQSIAAMEANIAASSVAMRSTYATEGFLHSFGVLDIVFGCLAIVTAFRIGSGSNAKASATA